MNSEYSSFPLVDSEDIQYSEEQILRRIPKPIPADLLEKVDPEAYQVYSNILKAKNIKQLVALEETIMSCAKRLTQEGELGALKTIEVAEVQAGLNYAGLKWIDYKTIYHVNGLYEGFPLLNYVVQHVEIPSAPVVNILFRWGLEVNYTSPSHPLYAALINYSIFNMLIAEQRVPGQSNLKEIIMRFIPLSDLSVKNQWNATRYLTALEYGLENKTPIEFIKNILNHMDDKQFTNFYEENSSYNPKLKIRELKQSYGQANNQLISQRKHLLDAKKHIIQEINSRKKIG